MLCEWHAHGTWARFQFRPHGTSISLDVSAPTEFTLEKQIIKQKEQTLLPAFFSPNA